MIRRSLPYTIYTAFLFYNYIMQLAKLVICQRTRNTLPTHPPSACLLSVLCRGFFDFFFEIKKRTRFQLNESWVTSVLSAISFNNCWKKWKCFNSVISLPVETVGFFKHYVFNSISDLKRLSLMSTEERSTCDTSKSKEVEASAKRPSYLVISAFYIWRILLCG